MKRKTFSALMLAAGLSVMTAAGCGAAPQTLEEPVNMEAESGTEMVSETETAEETEASADESVSATEEILPEEETETLEAAEIPEGQEITEGWESMQIGFGGEVFKLPASYKGFSEKTGWSFDLAEYGYENGYAMNPGDKTYGTIELENPEYPDTRLTVGFINTGDETVDITDCSIWCFDYNSCHGFKQASSYEYMNIGSGIGFGSTEEEVLAALGEPVDTYKSDNYVKYTFENNGNTVHVYVYEEYGVTEIDISAYNIPDAGEENPQDAE